MPPLDVLAGSHLRGVRDVLNHDRSRWVLNVASDTGVKRVLDGVLLWLELTEYLNLAAYAPN